MTDLDRVQISPTEGADQVFTNEFNTYLLAAHDKFTTTVHKIRVMRQKLIEKANKEGVLPTFPPKSDINSGEWKIPSIPDELRKPGIEISGPISIPNMAINALNPGPEGERAEGYLDDDEDSGGHRLVDTISASQVRLQATEGTLTFFNKERGRKYEVKEGALPFFMHRERGLHLDEPDVKIDGKPIPATILSTGLTLFYGGRAQIKRGQGVYFYLPKMEVLEEARFYKEFFDFTKDYLNLPNNTVIKAIPLVESLPIVYIMDEILDALGPYAGGLNAARWDLKASILEYVMADKNRVWPDRFGVDIKTTDFMANIFRRLVAICLRRGAVPIGGMATALPSRDDEINTVAAASIKSDKEWEANQGFIRAWVAHIFHMKAAADPFKDLNKSGWQPTSHMLNPSNFPVEIKAPDGPITMEGTHRNCRMVIEYVEGWLNGRGAKGIDSLEGKPGIHPALMEDLATGRISVAQLAQRIIHNVKTSDTGKEHNLDVVKNALDVELKDILSIRRLQAQKEDNISKELQDLQIERYHQAFKISLRWIKNYTEFNFRSLGSYSRPELIEMTRQPDAF